MQSLPSYSNLSKRQKIEATAAGTEAGDKKKDEVPPHTTFYGWQKDLQRLPLITMSAACAANQIGKTYTGTTIDAMHLLGDYPDDWVGHIDFAPLCWGLGFSMEKTRDLSDGSVWRIQRRRVCVVWYRPA